MTRCAGHNAAYLVLPSLHSTQPSWSENLSCTFRMSCIPLPSMRIPLRKHECTNSDSLTDGSASRGMVGSVGGAWSGCAVLLRRGGGVSGLLERAGEQGLGVGDWTKSVRVCALAKGLGKRQSEAIESTEKRDFAVGSSPQVLFTPRRTAAYTSSAVRTPDRLEIV